MDIDFYNALTEAGDAGEKRGVLLAKIAILKWMLESRNNRPFLATDEIQLYIVNLDPNEVVDDFVYKSEPKKEKEGYAKIPCIHGGEGGEI